MIETIAANLDAVRKESLSMLDTLASVKGKAYADCVHQMMLCTQVQNITSLMAIMIRKGGDVPEQAIEAITNSLSHTLSMMVTEYAEAKGITDDKVPELIKDTENINDATQHLMQTAIAAGQDGKSMDA